MLLKLPTADACMSRPSFELYIVPVAYPEVFSFTTKMMSWMQYH